MKNDKKVSVVMCTYNGAKFVRKQIESIINQSYPIYELIIQDDHSDDQTLSIVKEYADRYDFIKVFSNEGKRGVNTNFFSAIRRASGDFIAISDQDDIWIPQKIEWQVDSIGDAWLSAGITVPFWDEKDISSSFVDQDLNVRLERMIYCSMIAGHTMMFNRDFLDRMPNMDHWLDYYMYDQFIQIVAGAYEKIAYLHKVLVYQRRHSNAATYSQPLDYTKTIKNIYGHIRRTFHLYNTICKDMDAYFSRTYSLLESIPANTLSRKNAMNLALYHSKHSLLSRIYLLFFCVSLRDRIFHSVERNMFVSVARAIYFPVSCSDYFRYMAKREKFDEV